MNHSVNDSSCRRTGFTLIELLVVVSIIGILLALTVGALNFNSEADRIRKGARQLQSYLKGAQSRAIYEGSPVGVRLFVDRDGVASPSGRTVSTAAYIGARLKWSAPRDSVAVQLERRDLNGNGTLDSPTEDNVLLVRATGNPGWFNLSDRGFLDGDVRIRLPAGTNGNWYPFSYVTTEDLNGNGMLDVALGEDLDGDGMLTTFNSMSTEHFLILGLPYAGTVTPPPSFIAQQNVLYEMELAWQMLPEEPCVLPEGVVIDLDASRVPDGWRPANTGNGEYSPFVDIVFSPQGTVIGDVAGAGLLHLYICDRGDSEFLKELFIAQLDNVGKLPSGVGFFDQNVAAAPFVPLDSVPVLTTDWVGDGNTYIVGERRLVSVFGQTGNVVVSRVNSYLGAAGGDPDTLDPYDFDNSGSNNPDGLADDPFRFVETGEGGI